MATAIFTSNSKNKKIRGYNGARVCTTYASIKGSCPLDCKLLETKECYALHGNVGLIIRRLDVGVKPEDSLRVAREEAQKIDESFGGGPIPQDGAKGGRDLRLHTAGDCKTNVTAGIIAAAAERWLQRGGGSVWSYTHAYKHVKRESWGPVSIFASVDQPEEGLVVIEDGYAPARYVADFPKSGKPWKEMGVTWIPCPAQTKDDIGCADCRICMQANKLRKQNKGVAFEAHGCKVNKMKERLQEAS
jgi:hypothetical protein